MKKKTFTNEQIGYALRQVEAGKTVAEICRELGISQQTFYRWRRKFAGMGVAELNRLKELERENKRLKQLVADLSLDKHMLQEVIAKKALRPAQKRDVVDFLHVGYDVARRRACQLVGLNRSTYYYESQARSRDALRIRLLRPGKRPRPLRVPSLARAFAPRRLAGQPQARGSAFTNRRAFRCVPKVAGKQVSRPRVVRPQPIYPNQHWSMDFVHDQLADGRRFRCLTLVDHVSRVSPVIEVGSSLTGERVAAVLKRLTASHGLPEVIFASGNGTEFTSKAVDRWAYENGVKLL